MRLPLTLTLTLCALTAAAEPQKISFTRQVFPNAGQVGYPFIASADGSGERPLLGNQEIDYDAVWSPDGATIVKFTSERDGISGSIPA